MVKREKIPKTFALIYKALYNNYSDFVLCIGKLANIVCFKFKMRALFITMT
jgi:hypothetical protein